MSYVYTGTFYDKLPPKSPVKRSQNDKTLVASDVSLVPAFAHHPVPGLGLLGAALHLVDHGHDGRRLGARGHRGVETGSTTKVGTKRKLPTRLQHPTPKTEKFEDMKGGWKYFFL